MKFNYKLYFKYILFNTNQIFFKYIIKNNKNTNIFIYHKDLYYLILHFKLSSLFYSTQLIDILAYELPFNINKFNAIFEKKKISATATSILIYNFHTIFYNQRFFIFVLNAPNYNINKNVLNWTNTNSITELFSNANWLEREVAELNGIFFFGKKDLRNLMLQYGDNSTPLLKSFPSIGIKEIYYDSINDLLLQNPTTIQF